AGAIRRRRLTYQIEIAEIDPLFKRFKAGLAHKSPPTAGITMRLPFYFPPKTTLRKSREPRELIAAHRKSPCLIPAWKCARAHEASQVSAKKSVRSKEDPP